MGRMLGALVFTAVACFGFGWVKGWASAWIYRDYRDAPPATGAELATTPAAEQEEKA